MEAWFNDHLYMYYCTSCIATRW